MWLNYKLRKREREADMTEIINIYETVKSQTFYSNLGFLFEDHGYFAPQKYIFFQTHMCLSPW